MNAVFAVLVAFPSIFFQYSGGTDRLRVHATSPLPETVEDWARTVMADLDAGPLPPGKGAFHIYITGDGWQNRLFFAPVPGAGGLVYPMFSHANAFMSQADLTTDGLYHQGMLITPPRTASYYALHELTHLIQARILGGIGYFRTPRWIIEGMADYVALGPASAAARQAVATLPPGRVPLEVMMDHGSYPIYRVRITDALQSSSPMQLLTGQ